MPAWRAGYAGPGTAEKALGGRLARRQLHGLFTQANQRRRIAPASGTWEDAPSRLIPKEAHLSTNGGEKSNLILIGMPGAGKSTVGVVLAKRLGLAFLDTDLIIQAQEKCRLQQIIDRCGLAVFRQIEERMLLGLCAERSVIATGGSVVYSRVGLEALGRTGPRIYLQVPLSGLQQRIADMGQRGLVMEKGQNFEQLFRSRTPLYEEFADLTIACDDLNAEQVAAKIEIEVFQRWPELST